MKNLIIFGKGDIAQLAYYYFTKDQEYNVAAFTVDHDYRDEEKYLGLPFVDFENIEVKYSPDNYCMFIALSYTNLNKLRAKKYFEAKSKGYEIISYVSPNATVYDNVKIGENCFIFEDNTLQPFSKIGNNVTLWSGNHIGHHSQIKDHCFITSHVVISGGVVVEPYTFIGVNSTLRDHIKIGKECIIGAGSIIMKDTNEKEVFIAEKTNASGRKSNTRK